MNITCRLTRYFSWLAGTFSKPESRSSIFPQHSRCKPTIDYVTSYTDLNRLELGFRNHWYITKAGISIALRTSVCQLHKLFVRLARAANSRSSTPLHTSSLRSLVDLEIPIINKHVRKCMSWFKLVKSSESKIQVLLPITIRLNMAQTPRENMVTWLHLGRSLLYLTQIFGWFEHNTIYELFMVQSQFTNIKKH